MIRKKLRSAAALLMVFMMVFSTAAVVLAKDGTGMMPVEIDTASPTSGDGDTENVDGVTGDDSGMTGNDRGGYGSGDSNVDDDSGDNGSTSDSKDIEKPDEVPDWEISGEGLDGVNELHQAAFPLRGPASVEIDLSESGLTDDPDEKFTVENNVITIQESGMYALSGTSEYRIVVAADVTAMISLTNVVIEDVSGGSPFALEPGAAVTLVLVGESTLISITQYYAGLQVPVDTAVTILGEGTLAATGGGGINSGGAAGIGGGGKGPNSGGNVNNNGSGSITISGGTITAKGSSNGAGIGSAGTISGTTVGDITITDGEVYAYGGAAGSSNERGAGIGSSYSDNTGKISISGGKVYACGSDDSAGIGGGQNGSGGTIEISGTAIVKAKGGKYGAGIGSGGIFTGNSDGGNITITDSAQVFAYGGKSSAGIGSGHSNTSPGSAGTIVITGSAKVYAVGDMDDDDYTRSGAGIGSGNSGIGGSVTIGGTAQVTATGGNNAAGIGGGSHGSVDTIVIENTATVTAKGGKYAVGIGSGGYGGQGSSGSVIIRGTAVVTATGGHYGAGIGRGHFRDGDISVTIGGTAQVSASGGTGGAGIGGGNSATGGSVSVTIGEAAEVSAIGGNNGPGIGSGGYGTDSVSVTIGGTAEVNATGGNYGAGIGGGYLRSGDMIEITGGTVTAKGLISGAGIGGGYAGNGGDITISGGTIAAESWRADGKSWGAGIGGGENGHGGIIKITGGTITAKTLSAAAGIGGGCLGNGGDITISGTDTVVTAICGDYANGITANWGAGIGGGDGRSGGTIKIEGGTVTAIGSNYGAGIGGGWGGDGGGITISGGIVDAKANGYGAGIGGGYGGSHGGAGGIINITGGKVTATGGLNGGAGIGGGAGIDGSAGIDGGEGGSITIDVEANVIAYSNNKNRPAIHSKTDNEENQGTASLVNATFTGVISTTEDTPLKATSKADTVELLLPANYVSFGFTSKAGKHYISATLDSEDKTVVLVHGALGPEHPDIPCGETIIPSQDVMIQPLHEVIYDLNYEGAGQTPKYYARYDVVCMFDETWTGSRAGYTLMGWSSNSSGEGDLYTLGSNVSFSNLGHDFSSPFTLYAQWDLRPDASLTKTSNVTRVKKGEEIVYTIKAENGSDKNIWKNVTATDSLPDTVTYKSFHSADEVTVMNTDDMLTISFGDIARGESKTVTITVTVNDKASVGDIILNSVTARGKNSGEIDTEDPNPPKVIKKSGDKTEQKEEEEPKEPDDEANPTDPGDENKTSDGHEIGGGSGRDSNNPYDTIVIIGEEEVPLGVLERNLHIRYLNGYPDITVRPERNITRAEVAAILYQLLSDNAGKSAEIPQAFPDVPDSVWYSQYINYLASLGIVLGYNDGNFYPDAYISRAEFMTVVSRFDNLILTTGMAFVDVPEDHWAVKYINSAYIKSWIDGYEDYGFRPEQYITRAETVKIINTILTRLPETLPEGTNPYTDITESHWAFTHIMEASLEHSYERDDSKIEYWTDF